MRGDGRAYVATLPGRSSNVAWYDFEMATIFREGGGYDSAEAWRRALAASGANYLVVSHGDARAVLLAGHNPGLQEALLELVPSTPLDVPLYWQETRAASAVMEGLSRAVLKAAQNSLITQTTGIRIG